MKSEKEVRSFMADLETLRSDCECSRCTARVGVILGLRFALNMADEGGRSPDALAEAVAEEVALKASRLREALRANPT